MKILQVCPSHLSDVATLPLKSEKSFSTSQKKTNCSPLAHPTWKCHHTNSWIAKLFHLTEKACCVISNVEGCENSQLWVVVGGSERIGCDVWQLKSQACKCSEWPPLRYYMLPVFFDTDQSHNTLRCAEIQPMSQQAAAASLNMSISIHALLRRSTRATQIKQQQVNS